MLEIIIALYASGVFMAMWKLWFPSLKHIKEIAPYSLVARHQTSTTFVVLLIFTISLPLMISALLMDDVAETFKKSFVKGAVKENEKQ